MMMFMVNPQISYFRFDSTQNGIYRVYAECVYFSPHKMIIKAKDGIEYTITSDYNMKNMLLDDQLLLGIAGRGKLDKYDKMYPLPDNAKVTDSSQLFRTVFPEADHAEIVFNNPVVQNAQAMYEEKMNALKQLFQMRDDYAQRQINQTRILTANTRNVFPIRQMEDHLSNTHKREETPALPAKKRNKVKMLFAKKEEKVIDLKLQEFFKN